MKNLSSIRWIQNLTDQQRDGLLGLFVVLSVAIVYYLQWAYYLTGLEGSKVNVDQPERFFWWANDSRSYRSAGEWLFGREVTNAIGERPWLYPLWLGLARTLFGSNAEGVLWVSQFLMWLASGLFIYLALQNGTKSTIISILGAGVFFSHPSPLILTFHGMTESLNIFLIAMLCWVLTRETDNRYYLAILLLGLATVTKPIYLAVLILLILYVMLRDKQVSRLKQLGMIALLLAPIWIQLILSTIAIGKPTISTIGAYTFKNYLVADVHLRVEGMEWRESMKEIEDWDLRQQVTYLWDHQRETALAYRRHIIDSNLWTGSFFTLGEGNRLAEFARTANAIAAYLHLLMLPITVYYLISSKYSRSKETIGLLYLSFALQILTTGISTGQEDRLIITALPLWIVTYLLVCMGIRESNADSSQKGRLP
ncbi:MAG TPA: hypothetical protein VFQ23_20010 [Anaerolineales bacterium]|nr:hypothetical protein [Anaerolineales bacterium]